MQADANGPDSTTPQRREFLHRLLLTVGVLALVATSFILVWLAADFLLLAFAGILLAVFLRGLGDLVGGYTGLPAGWSLAVVVVVLVAVLAGAVWLLGPAVGDQLEDLTQSLPGSIDELEGRLKQYRWGRFLLRHLPGIQGWAPRANVLQRVTGALSTSLSALADLVIVLFLGLYLAIEPGVYTGGLLRLVPPGRQGGARSVLGALRHTLWRWLLGQLADMSLVGVSTAVGLWLLGAPLPLALGLLAGLLEFIPNFGPVVSLVPAVLLALTQSPTLALYVVLLYVGIQAAESYLFHPLLQWWAVALPPALIIGSEILAGMLFGFLGLLVATPLAASVLVLVNKLYVERVQGKSDGPTPARPAGAGQADPSG